MTATELLELAAKAAGYEKWNNEWWSMCDGANHWDPLRHNGQALMLAVKLRIDFDWWKSGIETGRGDLSPLAMVNFGDDPYAATRRAIVRAAAEIGRMKELTK